MEVSLRDLSDDTVINFIDVSILVFVEVSLRAIEQVSIEHPGDLFQSLFSWKYLLELKHLKNRYGIKLFQSLFSWKYLLETS